MTDVTVVKALALAIVIDSGFALGRSLGQIDKRIFAAPAFLLGRITRSRQPA